MQFAEALSVPSSNHLILTSVLLYFTSLIFLYGFIQVILLPSFFQNSLLFLIESLYFLAYCDLLAKLLFTQSGLVLIINSRFSWILFEDFLVNLFFLLFDFLFFTSFLFLIFVFFFLTDFFKLEKDQINLQV